MSGRWAFFRFMGSSKWGYRSLSLGYTHEPPRGSESSSGCFGVLWFRVRVTGLGSPGSEFRVFGIWTLRLSVSLFGVMAVC